MDPTNPLLVLIAGGRPALGQLCALLSVANYSAQITNHDVAAGYRSVCPLGQARCPAQLSGYPRGRLSTCCRSSGQRNGPAEVGEEAWPKCVTVSSGFPETYEGQDTRWGGQGLCWLCL